MIILRCIKLSCQQSFTQKRKKENTIHLKFRLGKHVARPLIYYILQIIIIGNSFWGGAKEKEEGKDI